MRGGLDPIVREQLVIYARELAREFRRRRSVQECLSEREEQMRALATISVAALEEQREWIALEIHDRIAQYLVSVVQQLQALQAMTATDSEARRVALRASALLGETIRETRAIMDHLHSAILDEFGIVAAIEDELRHFREETGATTTFHPGQPARLPKPAELALFRIFREALTNVRKHAPQASYVAVALDCYGGVASLEIGDDGLGFDVATALARKRVGGLISMRRRAEVLRGTFQVTSARGQGSKVIVRVPIDSASEAIGSRQ